MELGKTIREYREKAQMTQEQLAERIYVSRQTISAWENDKTCPDIQSLVLLAEIFNTTVDGLVKGDLETMKTMITAEDQKEFRKWTYALNILFALTIVSSVPLVFKCGWFGITAWVCLALALMVAAFKVESLKAKNNMRTVKEIIAFMEGKTLDEIEHAREDGKYLYQKAVLVLVFSLLSAAIAIVMLKLFT